MSPAPRNPAKDPRAGGSRKGADPRTARGNVAVKRALRGESVQHEPLLAFERTNYLLMGAGALLAVIGFALLRTGDISVAPFLLVVGYCGLVPAGILWRRKARPKEAGGPGGATGRGANSSAG
jgi:hypothetical protein